MFLPLKNQQSTIRLEAEYQLGRSNYQQKATVALDELLFNCKRSIGVLSEFQEIDLGEQKFNFKRTTLGASLQGRVQGRGAYRYPIYLSVGVMNYAFEETLNRKIGFELGSKMSVPGPLRISLIGKIAWWQTFWQYQVRIEKTVKRYSFAAEANKIKGYEELNLKFGREFNY